jgi:hypothetical protein
MGGVSQRKDFKSFHKIEFYKVKNDESIPGGNTLKFMVRGCWGVLNKIKVQFKNKGKQAEVKALLVI